MTDGRKPSRSWQAHPPARSVYSREWRASSDRKSDRFSRQFKLRAVAIGLLIVLAIIAVLLAPTSSPIPSIQIVTFGIGVYGGRANPQGNLPVNPFGEQDARAFSILNEIHPGQFLPVRQEANVLNGAQFLSFLRKESQASGLHGKHLIVFCTMHAVLLPAGGIELFAIDALPDSPGTASGKMIPLTEVVSCLEESSAKKVVLILDLARLESNWRMGILNNDLSAQVSADWPGKEAVLNSKAVSNREDKVTIFLSTGPGQVSWPANRNSAFVRFLIDGLSGAADGWVQAPKAGNSGAHDQRITLKELFAYTKYQVNEWTLRHFGSAQTAQLLGNITDFELATVSPKFSTGSNLITDALALKSQLSKSEDVVDSAAEVKPSGDTPSPSDERQAHRNEVANQADRAKSTADDSSAAKSSTSTWPVRLAELRKARDLFSDVGGRGRHAVCRVNPLLWRTFEARLRFAGALERGGAEELVPQVLQQADQAYQKLTARTAALGSIELHMSEARQHTLKELGFGLAEPTTAEAFIAVDKYLQGLAKTAKSGDGGTNKDAPEPKPAAVQEWLKRELFRDTSPENWKRLQQIVEQLVQIDRLPTTDDSQLLRAILSADDACERFSKGDALQRMLSQRDRLRILALNAPESAVLLRQGIDSSFHSLYAAERWMFATTAAHTNVREWLDKSELSIRDIEQTTRRYQDTIGVWSDLLAELPEIAEWVANRASNDDKRKVDWSRLRELARHWAECERNGSWDVESFRNSWFDKPARWTDLERLLVAQFIGAQKLKRALMATQTGSTAGQLPPEELLKVANQALRDRGEFWEEFRRTFPRLGTADYPTPLMWCEANQLSIQPWISTDDRRKLADLQQFEPRGDALIGRPAEPQSLWQGFWSVATLGLLSNPSEFDEIVTLWKNWDRMAELSQGSSVNSESPAELESLRKRRAELGRSIRQQWNSLQSRAQAAKGTRSVPTSHLLAAAIDPTEIPEHDPDTFIREERQAQFVDWMAVYLADWRHRAMSSGSAKTGYAKLAEKLEGVLAELGTAPSSSPLPARVGFQQVNSPRFDASRRAALEISVTRPTTAAAIPLKLNLIGSRIRLLGTDNAKSSALSVRSIPADGQMNIPLQLDDDVDSPQTLLLVLTEDDGAPIEYQRVLLHPPFDPTQWRIEFVDAVTGTALEHIPMSGSSGMKFFLPPSANVSIKANLIRPAKDLSRSAKVSLSALTDTGKIPLVTDLDVTLEPGKERTPLPIEVPLPSKDKELPPAKEKEPTAPVADLARGMLFEMIPEGQNPIEYRVQPTFWSAGKFVNDPQPVIRDDRFSLDLERRPLSNEDVLLPKKISVELNLPDSLRNSLNDYTLGGPVAVGQKLTLSFKLPKNWSDQTRDQNWNVALDVAGLPHPYRWRIEPSGVVALVTGQPPQLNIRLLLPSAGPKAAPRLEPILQQGKDPLRLQFQVDATELDRTEELGDWTLAYSIVRASDTGYEPTPLQNSWRLYSSVQRHVLLDGVQGGAWKIRTQAQNYEREESDADIRGLSGRFQVQAKLTRSAAPSQPLASATLRFAIDDDAPPTLEIHDLGLDPRTTDKDIRCRIDAVDLESGIQSVAFGFDKNSDKQLQPDEEMIEERSFAPLDHPKIAWQIVIPKSKIPKLEKDEETRNLIFTAKNGLGIAVTRVFPVTFRKPAVPKKSSTGTLIVNLKISRGAKSTIQISGPTSRLEETSADSMTFTDLPPGQYQVNVKVNYAVIGRKDEGEAKVEVKVGETITAKVPLSIVTGK